LLVVRKIRKAKFSSHHRRRWFGQVKAHTKFKCQLGLSVVLYCGFCVQDIINAMSRPESRTYPRDRRGIRSCYSSRRYELRRVPLSHARSRGQVETRTNSSSPAYARRRRCRIPGRSFAREASASRAMAKCYKTVSACVFQEQSTP
jgi:hypothetical protein